MPKKAGQPTKYKPEYCAMLVAHMGKGHSFESFGGKVKVSFDTLYEWAKANPKFSEAKKAGRSAGLETLEALAFQGMQGKLPGWNAATWIFFVKNIYRKQFSDRQHIEISAKPTIIEKIGGGEIVLIPRMKLMSRHTAR